MKKLFAMLLTALLAVSVLAACDRPLNTEVNDGREELSSAIASQKATTAAPTTTAKTTPVPSEKAFLEEYFGVLSNIPVGTAGGSLKTAEAAVAAFQFAQDHSLATCDIQQMRDNMEDVYEDMTVEKRSDFDAGFMAVVQLMDDAKDNYSAVAGVFEDAGVKDTFETLRGQEGAWENWDTLKSHTLTIGNSDGD